MTDKENKKSRSIPGLIKQLSAFFSKLFYHKKSLIPRGAGWQDVKLDINPEVQRYLEMRHVQENELKQVIFRAETTGDKLYQPDANRYLGKLKIGKATFYADYSYGDEKFIVKYGYAHRSDVVG
jgi:hypothetical protein